MIFFMILLWLATGPARAQGPVVAVLDTQITGEGDFLQGASFIDEATPSSEGPSCSITGPQEGLANHGCKVARIIHQDIEGLFPSPQNAPQDSIGEVIQEDPHETDPPFVVPVAVVNSAKIGRLSDLVPAIRWAAGLEVGGRESNENPAKVINISINGNFPCSWPLQRAIDDAIIAGATIVASAGNDGRNLSAGPSAPASCRGVLAVGVTAGPGQGPKSTSNYGQGVVFVSEGPGLSGTSSGAPKVAKLVRAMISENPELPPLQVQHIIRTTSQPKRSADRGTYLEVGPARALGTAQEMAPDPERFAYVASSPPFELNQKMVPLGCLSVGISLSRQGPPPGGPTSFFFGGIFAWATGQFRRRPRRGA